MNVRKERMHQCGLTNLDFKTKGDINNDDKFNFTTARSDFGTMGRKGFHRADGIKGMSLPKQQKLPSNFVSPFPINEARMRTTMDFYKENGKKFKPPVLTTKARN